MSESTADFWQEPSINAALRNAAAAKSFCVIFSLPERRGYADAARTSSVNVIGGLNYLLNGSFHFGRGLVVNARPQIADGLF
jgi:hypothetical protein